MKLFICTDHDCVCWPVGVASVIVAKDRHQARRLLKKELTDHAVLDPDEPFTLQEMSLTEPSAEILRDGDY